MLRELVSEAKSRARGTYDCIVPVSGGKDSWYQVAVAKKELGLSVLTVTWKTPGRTELGQRNLDALVENLGVDHIDFTISPDVERRFMIAAFEEKGATAIPMHLAIFSIPFRMAVQFRVPLVLWGENPQLEFGGNEKEQLSTVLDEDWVRKHGVNNNTGVEDWIGHQGLSEADLLSYRMPGTVDFAPKSIFLGAFRRWNSFENARIAQSLGFCEADQSKVGTWSFADIDCHFIAIHHFLKWYKFGMTRAFDNLSVQIREGQIGREDAIRKLGEVGVQIPTDDIARFCRFAGRSTDWFWQTVETFRNTAIWKRDAAGVWTIPGFIAEDWLWSQ
jgi:N-acetyl sugar amidotransferase